MSVSPDAIEIVAGTEADTEFFLEVEEQTTWENLPADRRQMSRDELRSKLIEAHDRLLTQPNNVIFIARDRDSGQNLGLLWLGTRFNAITAEDEAWVYNVTVLAEHRGCGVGKRLMDCAEEYAREQGFEVIGLAVATHNEVARKLYLRMDYEESNILMRKPLS